MTELPKQDPEAIHPSTTRPPEAPPRVAFELLAQGQSEVIIEFRGQSYRLRATRNGKLILNK